MIQREGGTIARRVASVLEEVRWVVLFLASVVVLGSVIMFHLSVREDVIQLGYTLSQVNNQGRKLVRQRHEFELERAIMKNPEEIGRRAQEQFGMRIPDKSQLLKVRSGGKSGAKKDE